MSTSMATVERPTTIWNINASAKEIEALGFVVTRRLESGELIGVNKMLYTYGLCYGIDNIGIAGRYCYEHFTDAIEAMVTWDGAGDPQGPWIKHKGYGGEVHGPGLSDPLTRSTS